MSLRENNTMEDHNRDKGHTPEFLICFLLKTQFLFSSETFRDLKAVFIKTLAYSFGSTNAKKLSKGRMKHDLHLYPLLP